MRCRTPYLKTLQILYLFQTLAPAINDLWVNNNASAQAVQELHSVCPFLQNVEIFTLDDESLSNKNTCASSSSPSSPSPPSPSPPSSSSPSSPSSSSPPSSSTTTPLEVTIREQAVSGHGGESSEFGCIYSQHSTPCREEETH